jgi:hypothetical protein
LTAPCQESQCLHRSAPACNSSLNCSENFHLLMRPPSSDIGRARSELQG